MNYQQSSPGEWEVDGNGKRFRFDGRCIEYEPTVITTCGTITQRQLDDLNARKKEKQKPVYKPPEPSKTCPLKSGMYANCDKEACAWYTATGCAQTCPHPATGKKCPYKHTACTYDCALRKETTNEQK